MKKLMILGLAGIAFTIADAGAMEDSDVPTFQVLRSRSVSPAQNSDINAPITYKDLFLHRHGPLLELLPASSRDRFISLGVSSHIVGKKDMS